MTQVAFVDGYVGELLEDLGDGTGQTTLEAVAAPTALQSNPFYIVFGTIDTLTSLDQDENVESDDYEVCLVTAGQSTESWTVARAQFNTSAKAHDIGETFRMYNGPSLHSMFSQVVASGEVTLVAGTKAIANTAITANSIVKPYSVSSGGTVGALSVVPNAGVGFTINSTSNTDTSKVYYEIVSY